MNVSSRTPEGDAYHCPVCGGVAALETSDAGDTLCPRCGQLLWQLRDSLEAITLSPIASLALADPLTKHLDDSLDVVELVMQFEDTAGVSLTDEDYQIIRTVEDALRWLRERQGE